MLHLVTFGGLALESVNEAVAPRLSAQRLAILAVLAAEGDRRVSRERLTGLFWPDTEEERARHSLRQALYTLRQEIGRDVVRSDLVLSLDPAAITSDIAAFRAAIGRGDRPAAGRLVRGSFLQGFYLPNAASFQRWVEEERVRLHTEATSAIASLATDAASANDLDTAIAWWRQLTTLDPLSGRFALGYLRALAARGDRAEALAFVRAHTVLVRRELETDPDPEVRQLEASLRSPPSSSATPARSASLEPRVVAVAADLSADVPTEHASRGVATVTPATPATRTAFRQRLTRIAVVASAVAAGILLARGVIWRPPSNARAAEAMPTLAVGVIRDEVLDSARLGSVLTDMLSTNLARVSGLRVVGNTRVLGLIPPGMDTSAAAYAEAARRAGATELLEGRVVDDSRDAFTIEMRRVDLRNGLLKGAYRASARSRFRLVDSMTAMVARHLQLAEPVAPPNDVTTRSATAYRLYQEGLRAYYRFDAAMARQMMRAALDDDSTFAMAAYYDALLTDSPQSPAPTERAIRLADGASERERLVIRVDLMSRGGMVSSLASQIADTLAMRYPNDARALEAVARARQSVGDWPAAANALERAIVIDSAAFGPRVPCYLCEDFTALSDIYFWWDSLPAAARVAGQYVRLHPDWPRPWEITVWAAAKMGDTTAARHAFDRSTALHSNPRSTGYETKMNLLLDLYDNVERDLRPLLESPRPDDYSESRWFLLIALRNQGRLREARLLNETGRVKGFARPRMSVSPEAINVGLLALESGDARTAAAAFTRSWQTTNANGLAPGTEARYRAWRGTLAGMAIAATGDTAAVLRMADTVEYWGRRSFFGRDQKAHHYLRGMVHVAGGRDDDAIREFRQAIYSYTLGFTRVNLELGRALLRRGRAREAAAVVGPALRGEVDASNLYVTRTELHELLAQAFDRAGELDSAATHYRTVVRAWVNADEMFHARRDAARGWLARYERQRSR